MKQTHMSHQFVEFIPEKLDSGVLYISPRYGTAAHKCCCGCGEEVITPLTPTDWSLRMDGNLVTLHPSIGNWSFNCQSHYWIRRSQIIWADQMSQQEIERGRANERASKQAYFAEVNRKKILHTQLPPKKATSQTGANGSLHSLWMAIKHWWKS